MLNARLFFLLAVVALMPDPVAAQDKPYDLKQLKDQIGTWDAEMTVRPAASTPEGAHLKFVQVVRPILQGRFIQSTYNADDYQFLSLATYDSKEDVYRLWMYDSMGAFPKGDNIGKGNPKARTIDWKNSQGDGTVAVSKWHQIDDDHFRWNTVVKDKGGKVLLDLEGKWTRRK